MVKMDTDRLKFGYNSSLPIPPLNHLHPAITELPSCPCGEKKKKKKMREEGWKEKNLPSPCVLNMESLKRFSHLISGPPGYLNIVHHLFSLTLWLLKHSHHLISLTTWMLPIG
jgi:hypothetical protein